MTPEFKEKIDALIAEHKVVLFMKGYKTQPACGFSNRVVSMLNEIDIPYHDVNIFDDPELRSGMKDYSSWPTFPQIYIDGEFVGGCDIVIEQYQNGELQEAIEVAMAS